MACLTVTGSRVLVVDEVDLVVDLVLAGGEVGVEEVGGVDAAEGEAEVAVHDGGLLGGLAADLEDEVGDLEVVDPGEVDGAADGGLVVGLLDEGEDGALGAVDVVFDDLPGVRVGERVDFLQGVGGLKSSWKRRGRSGFSLAGSAARERGRRGSGGRKRTNGGEAV